MSVNLNAFTTGQGIMYINDLRIGWVTDVQLETEVESLRLEEPNVQELRTYKLYPHRRRMRFSCKFGEVDIDTLKLAFATNNATVFSKGIESYTEKVRLYGDRFFNLALPTDSVVLKRLNGIAYLANQDYIFDAINNRVCRVPNGSIPDGSIVLIEYDAKLEAGQYLSLGSTTESREVCVRLLHTYPDGISRLELKLWRVALNGAAFLQFDSNELMGVPWSGEVLIEPNNATMPYGFLRLWGKVALGGI